MSVDLTVEERVAVLMINRPESMNAVDPETREQLFAACARIRDDEAIRVAIVTGAGTKAFCTGSDLKKTIPTENSFAQQMFGSADSDALVSRFDFDKPLIAAINGYAIGGGFEIALACDIRIASDNAQFALSEVRVGSLPGSGGTQRLPRTVGMSDAMLMLLTGDRIDSSEAYRMGLVSRVVPSAELMPTALGIARRIAENAPLSVRAVKRLVRRGMDLPLSHALDLERYTFGLLFTSEDRIEGRKAFAEKRKPEFKGR
jgi:E-phenylitaconyl-CoA hydratase